jgi:hypothetical protein
MAVAISVPRDDSPQRLYERERHLAAQRELYEWDRRPGLPPMCKGVPAPERLWCRAVGRWFPDLSGGPTVGPPPQRSPGSGAVGRWMPL